MRFLVSVIDNQTGTASEDEMASIDVFNDRLRTGGHWILACGITAPDQATVIDGRGAEVVTADGPLHASSDYISGFWLIEAASHDEASALATEGSKACGRRVELRPLLG